MDIHKQTNETKHSFSAYIKINSKEITDSNLRPKTVKFLENIGSKFLDFSLNNVVLNLTPKAKITKAKINKWDYTILYYTIEAKRLLHSKGNHRQNEKATYRMRENICTSHI